MDIKIDPNVKNFIKNNNCRIIPKNEVPMSEIKTLTKKDYEDNKSILIFDKGFYESYFIKGYLALVLVSYNNLNIFNFDGWSTNIFKFDYLFTIHYLMMKESMHFRDNCYFCIVNISENEFLKLKLSI